MHVRIKQSPKGLEHLSKGQNHWNMLHDTEGADFITKVYGVDFRDGIKFYLLIPDKRVPMDVFFSRAEIFDIEDATVPQEWGVTEQEVSSFVASDTKLTKFFGYPIFCSLENFTWRLSEGDLSQSEKKAVLDLLE